MFPSFLNAEALEREHPFTFWRPSTEHLLSISVGDKVKALILSIDGVSELFRGWFSVLGRDGDRLMESSANWSWVSPGTVISADPMVRTLIDTHSDAPSSTKFRRENDSWSLAVND